MSHAKENDIEEGLQAPSPSGSQVQEDADDNSSSSSSSAQFVEINPWSARSAGPDVSVDDNLVAALAVVARLEEIDDGAESSSLPREVFLSHGSNSPIMASGIGSEQSDLQEGELPSEPRVSDTHGLERPIDIELEIGGDESNILPTNTDTPKKIEMSTTVDQTVVVGERDIEQGLVQIPYQDPSAASLAQPEGVLKFPIIDDGKEVDEIPATPPSTSPASITINDVETPPLPPAMAAAMMIEAVYSEESELEMIGGGGIDSSLSPVPDHERHHHSTSDDNMIGDGGTDTPHIGMMEDSIGDSNAPSTVPTDIGTAVGPIPPINAKEESDNVIKTPDKSKRLFVSRATTAAAKKKVPAEMSVPTASDIEPRDEPILEESIAAGPSSSNMFEGSGIQVMIPESPSTSSEETDLNDTFYTAADQVDEETEGANEKVAQDEASISSHSKGSSVNVDSNTNDDDSSKKQEGRHDDAAESDPNDTFDTAADQDVDKESDNADEEIPKEESADCSNIIDSSVDDGTKATNQADFNQQEGSSDDAAKPDLNKTFDTAADQDADEEISQEETVDHSNIIDSSVDVGTNATSRTKSNQQEEQLEGTVATDLSDACEMLTDQKSDKRAVDANEEAQQKDSCGPSTSNESSEDSGTLDKNDDAVETTRVQKLEEINEGTSQEQLGSPSNGNDSSFESTAVDQEIIREQEDLSNKVSSPPDGNEKENELAPAPFAEMPSKADRDAQDVDSSAAAPPTQSSNSDDEIVEAADIDQASIKHQEDRPDKVSSPPKDNEAEYGLALSPLNEMLSNVEKEVQDENPSDAAPRAQFSNSDDEVVDRGVDDDAETVPLGIPVAPVTLSTRLEAEDDETRPLLPPTNSDDDQTSISDVIGPEKSNLASGLEMIRDDGPEPPIPVGEVMDGKSDGTDMPPIGLEDISGEDSDDAITQSIKSNDPPTAQDVVQEKMGPSTDYDRPATASGVEPTIEPAIESIGDESLATVPFDSTILDIGIGLGLDLDLSLSLPLSSGDHAPTGHNMDEEAHMFDEEKQEEEERHSIISSISEPNDQGQSEYVKPSTNVPDDVVVIDAVAEPLLPWWGQKRTMILLGLICFFAIAVAVVIGVSFSRDEVISVASTPAPSTSAMPTFEPTTSPLTFAPTEVPSSSQVPSYTPTIGSTKYVEPK